VRPGPFHSPTQLRVFGQKIFITTVITTCRKIHHPLFMRRRPTPPKGSRDSSAFIGPIRDEPTAPRRAQRLYWASIDTSWGSRASREPAAPDLVARATVMSARERWPRSWAAQPRPRILFIMMNAAPSQVWNPGRREVAERAYSKAAQFARERMQSRSVRVPAGPLAIVDHPSVAHVLMLMRAQTHGLRARSRSAAAHCRPPC